MLVDRRRAHLLRRFAERAVAVCVVLSLTFPIAPTWADRTQLKSGWNIFSVDQDVQIGRKIAQDAESRLPMLTDERVNAYLSVLGHNLANYAPGAKFAYEFRVVDSRLVNSFALPGGFVFIDRGIIEAASDEAQLAGVMAHEISHVALRHGTIQATHAQMSTGVLGILGGVIGGGATSGIVAQVGDTLASSSVLFKYTRANETQADVLGTQILYDAGYDPRALGQFFESMDSGAKTKRFAAFFADHPALGNRVERIDDEVDKLGGIPSDYKTDSAEFREIRRYLLSMPPPREDTKQIAQEPVKSIAPSAPAAPSEELLSYKGETFSMQYPANWKVIGQGDSVSFVPPGGKVKDSRGNLVTGYGVMVSIFQPPPRMSSRPADDTLPATPPESQIDRITDQLLTDLQQSSLHLKAVGSREEIQMDGQRALSVRLENDSPLGGQESDWLVTVARPEGVIYFLCTAPAKDSANYEAAFQKIISSIHLDQ